MCLSFEAVVNLNTVRSCAMHLAVQALIAVDEDFKVARRTSSTAGSALDKQVNPRKPTLEASYEQVSLS